MQTKGSSITSVRLEKAPTRGCTDHFSYSRPLIALVIAKTVPSHRNRQHAQKFGKDRACVFGDILADRQTHRQTYSSQYFATAPAGEVINRKVQQQTNTQIHRCVCLASEYSLWLSNCTCPYISSVKIKKRSPF